MSVQAYHSISAESSSITSKITSVIQNAFSNQNIFYPGESATYKVNKSNLSNDAICFKAHDALFYNITFMKKNGERSVAIHSEHIEEMKQFLAQNDIPIRDFGSDCQYYDNLGLAHYYTTDPDVCTKLSKILLTINQFDLSGLNMDEFLN
jgi:hypothetical protein